MGKRNVILFVMDFFKVRLKIGHRFCTSLQAKNLLPIGLALTMRSDDFKIRKAGYGLATNQDNRGSLNIR
jgi:hypothetical protein